MRKPKMILFDYGQTLANETGFDGVAGNRAVLQYAVKNKYGYTAEDVQAEADRINAELGRFVPQRDHLFPVEVTNHMFKTYLYHSMGIEVSLSREEMDRVFWKAASPGVPTDGIQDFLAFLKEQNIRTGVISNITYCVEVVENQINELLPQHSFEFILATSEYMFRKPHKRIFELAMEKAELPAEDIWYVGDNYLCDVVGARNAGLFPVWYIGASANPQGENDVLTVSHWNDLIEILKKCSGSET